MLYGLKHPIALVLVAVFVTVLMPVMVPMLVIMPMLLHIDAVALVPALIATHAVVMDTTAMSRPAGDGSNAGQLNRSRSMSVSVEICGSEKSQVPPASQAYPSRQCVIWSADVGRFTSAIVLRFILRSFAAGGTYSLS
jgi:hypothetical protein